MNHIVLFGAGKSATCLIDYLAAGAARQEWTATIADASLDHIISKTGNAPGITPVGLNVEQDADARFSLVQQAHVVISLMPPALHLLIAQDCLAAGKHLLTASYADAQMKSLAPQIAAKNLLFLCEMGLDPGIDHMSAMQLLDGIKAAGGTVTSFKSHCGGLVAPESDTNPWHYKISWNPRNVVLAGKAGAVFKENGYEKRLGYHDLFSTINTVEIPGQEPLACYPNRDSMSYIPLYGLEQAGTFLRTTLRHPDFISAWNLVCELELTDETVCYDTTNLSLAQFYQAHAQRHGRQQWLNDYLYKLQHTDAPLSGADMAMLYLRLDDTQTLINKGQCSAADVLQWVLEQQLALQPGDKDMIVMVHEIEYRLNGRAMAVKSWLRVKGDDHIRTAMAKTVGLPLGIAAKLILNGSIKKTGLHIPINRDIYEPVLLELERQGIQFEEKTAAI